MKTNGDLAQRPGQLLEFLSGIGLPHLRDRLTAEDIDMSVLPLLVDDDLKELGFSLGVRKRLLKGIRALGAAAGKDAPWPDAPGAGDVQLRRLSVLFCDMVGSTRLGEELDIDRMQVVLQHYYDIADRIVRRHGGHLAMSQGDGLVFLFGYPRVLEGFAERCVVAAHDLQGALIRSPVALAGRDPIRIATRIGIATGQAAVGVKHNDTSGDHTHLVGPAVNRAARLQAVARPNGIVVDRKTRELTETSLSYSEPESVSLKGLAEPVDLYHVVSLNRVAATAAKPIHLVGRDAESAVLGDLWRRGRQGHPATLTIHGDTGIGKSALVQSFMATEVDPSARVINLVATAMAAQSPLRPVANTLAKLTGPDAAQTTLAALLNHAPPEVAERAAQFLEIAAAPDGDASIAASDREATLELLTGWILGRADRPTVVVLENAQWADDSTRELLDRAAARAQAEKASLLMIAITRDDDTAIWTGQGAHQTLSLPPLAEAPANLLLDRFLGGAPVPKSVRENILHHSGGNPLMLETLGHALREHRLSELADVVEVPHTIYESVAQRLDSLQSGRGVIEALAVLGTSAHRDLLDQIVQSDNRDIDRALTALDRARLTERRTIHGREVIAFRHQAYRDVIYEQIAGPVRERLHLDTYRALAQGDAPETRPDILARHALAGQDWADAARHALDAGAGYLKRSALPEAGHYLEMAAAACERLPSSEAINRDRLRAITGLAAVERSRFGIATDRSAELGQHAVALAREVGDAKAELLALNGLYSHALVRADYPRAENHAQALSKAAKTSGDDTFLMIGARATGAVALHRGDQTTAQRNLDWALGQYDREAHLPLAHAHGYDHAEICAALLAMSLWISGDLRRACQLGAFAIDHAREIDHAHSLAQAISFRVMWGALARHGPDLTDIAAEAVEVSEKHGIRVMRSAGRLFAYASQLCLHPDRPTAAEMAELTSRVAEFRTANPFNYVPLLKTVLAEVYLRADDLHAAQAALAGAMQAETRTGEIWTSSEVMRLRARLAAADGDDAGALRLRREALDVARRTQAATIALRIACDIAEADLCPRTVAGVRDAFAELVSRDEGWDVRRAKAILQAGPGT
ncbi:adenylate/guanylate cyclase domain-containing protein [Maliponia aquimaris]|uniref:Adenylate cyclase 1 n=1 Tax=Maliponia aquimaris TaxID=1673631 RepID=A0A238L6P6_9RHOB|nr:adenylate/guanylate cyclase domain-containing protein [Maliponia aquimaris]SMX50669.1 Adenylate cyclase 1 [Maliponia aquimaris]